MYNEDWRDPDEGYAPLPADEFVKKIRLDSVSVWEEEALMLRFDDGGLLGGHTIELFWDADETLGPAGLIG